MTKHEYLNEINMLRGKIKKGETESIESSLQKLYRFKPVSALWFLARAELNKKLGKPFKSPLEETKPKTYLMLTTNNEMRELYDFDKNTALEQSNVLEYKRLDLLQKMLFSCDVTKYEANLQKARQSFIDNCEDIDLLIDLRENYYINNEHTLYFVVSFYLEKVYNIPYLKPKIESLSYNYGYLEEKLSNNSSFILIVSENNQDDIDILSYLLAELEKSVYIILKPEEIEVEQEIAIKDTLQVSLDNVIRNEQNIIIPSITIKKGENILIENTDLIVDYICENFTCNDSAILLSSGKIMSDFIMLNNINKRFERLTSFEHQSFENNMHFARVGSYLTYISEIYKLDANVEIERKAEVDFSIVIPVRNSITTFRHTLDTCLNQNYAGSYEIVVSDNSDEENFEIYNYVTSLNDTRIKYYKTPRKLILGRSFEFAYLKTRGDFVFSIGADDGVLPWALDVLKKFLNSFPNEDIIQWERGFYAWPGFNGGQQHQFTIPREYKKDEYNAYIKATNQYIDPIKDNSLMIYLLPNLYINSGFRRRYMKTLIEKTGVFIGGESQDIPTGIKNVAINENILNMYYPLTIAGMSSSSIGGLQQTNTNLSLYHEKTINERKETYIGTGSRYGMRQTVPQLSTDFGIFYSNIANVCNLGIYNDDIFKDSQEVKKMLMNLTNSCNLLSDSTEYVLNLIHQVSGLFGDDIKKWYEENYVKAIQLRYVDYDVLEKYKTRKTYEESTIDDKCGTWDASKFGVTNIKEACDLFEKITGL